MPCPGLQGCAGLYCLTGLMCGVCLSALQLSQSASQTSPAWPVWAEWTHNAVTEPRGERGGGTIACYDEINLTELQVLILTRYLPLWLGV